MANNVTGNPVYIDSTGTIFSQRFKFESGTWDSATAGGQLQMTDISGRIVYDGLCYATNYPMPIPKIGWVNGLIVTVIGSGKVMIYVAHK
jgi:hypothetical protein